MRYVPEDMRWVCDIEYCKQVAFPPMVAEKGKPIIGKGEVELVRTKDPDGDKNGRYLLRAIDNNVIIDITEVISGYTEGLQDHELVLSVTHYMDAR